MSQYHKVTAVDIVPEKVELINRKKSPIQDEYIEKYLTEKELDLTATLDAKEAYSDVDVRKKALMEQNGEADSRMFKMKDDPRIIGGSHGIGAFIHKYSIDEFPQFWNVLKGDMSLVGTRPSTRDEWDKYEFWHRVRLAAKPGITGMWQVSGRSKITDFDEVVRLDREYIQRWSKRLDILILVKTVLLVFKGDGAW